MRPFPRGDVVWTDNVKKMESGKLLWATGVSHLKQEKQKKSSNDAATDGDSDAFVLRSNVAWTDNVKNDGQRKTAVGNWRHSHETRKTKKIE